MRPVLPCAALVTGTILPIVVAQAQALASQGDVTAVVTDTTTGRGLNLGGGRTLYVLESNLVVQGADGHGLLNGDGGDPGAGRITGSYSTE